MKLKILLKTPLNQNKNVTHFFLFLMIFFQTNEIISQDKNVLDVIDKEFYSVKEMFNKSMFIEVFSEGQALNNVYDVISIDTIHLYLKYKNNNLIANSVDLIKIRVKLKGNLINIESDISSKILEYCIISDSKKWYRLFGFYTTDMNYFYFTYGKEGLISLCNELVVNNILTKKQAKCFYKVFVNSKKEYHKNINRPCVLLQYYFAKKNINKSNTIVLPLEPLKLFVK